MKKQTVPVEIPNYILARSVSLASHFKCSPKTIILAGIMNVIEIGNNLRCTTSNQEDDYRFRLMIADSVLNQGSVSAAHNSAISYAEIIQNSIADYTNTFQGHFTKFDARSKTPWLVLPRRGEIAGRYTYNENKITLSLPFSKLSAFTIKKGINKQNLTKWAEGQGGVTANVMLAPKSIVTRCLVLPIIQEETING